MTTTGVLLVPLSTLTASASTGFVSTKPRPSLCEGWRGRRRNSFCEKDGNVSRLLGIFTFLEKKDLNSGALGDRGNEAGSVA